MFPILSIEFPIENITKETSVTEAEAKKAHAIVVNGRAETWEEKEISFEQVIKLAFPTPPAGSDIRYTVTFHKGEGDKHEGTLTKGESVKVKNDMVFDVTATDKS